MQKSNIEWCDYVFNPITGCLHDCRYCYAKGFANRFGYKMPPNHKPTLHELEEPVFVRCKRGKLRINPYPFGFEPTFHKYKLNGPQRVKRPQNVFVGSMSDMWGNWVPFEWQMATIEACQKAKQHRYLFLTKNPKKYAERMNKSGNRLEIPSNMWFGATLTKMKDLTLDTMRAICGLQENQKINLFYSLEPLQDYIYYYGIEQQDALVKFPPKWIIVGADTSKEKNKIMPTHGMIKNIVDQCKFAGTPIFMKKSLAPIWGQDLIQEYPEGLRK